MLFRSCLFLAPVTLLANPFIANTLIVTGLALALVAGTGLAPVCLYAARLADWATDDTLARRLRRIPWLLAFSFLATAAIAIVLPLLSGGPISFGLTPLGTMLAIGVLLSTVFSIACFMQLGNLLRWVLTNREESFASSVRRNERIMNRVSTVTPRRDPAAPPPSKEPPQPERVWTGVAHRKPQGNYLAPSSNAEEIGLAPPEPPSERPPPT